MDLRVKAVPSAVPGRGLAEYIYIFETVLRTNLGIGVAEQACDLKFFLWLPMSLIDAGKWRVSG
jgi:hypothetical protein